MVRNDSVKFLRKTKQSFDLILADPPFPWGDFDGMLDAAFSSTALTDFGMLVVESEKKHEVTWENDTREILRQKTFDRSFITILSRKVAE